jgi:phosphoribosylaminoimidazole-succinocarboxamide synthase
VSVGLEHIDLASYPLLRRGKVRDVFDLGEDLLLVATDRISAFDVVLPSILPGKGQVLTAISSFWFDRIADIVPTQLTGRSLDDLDLSAGERDALEGRSVIARKAERVDIECVVRAAMAGTAWKEYLAHGTVAGVALPAGLRRGDTLPEPLFTPAIKNDDGHDENIDTATLRSTIGSDLADQLEQLSHVLFQRGSAVAMQAGFMLADTKFEFGFIDGHLAIIDEVLTPDSSRYWDVRDRVPGKEPPAFDKQPVRDWLEDTGWDKSPPGPALPDSIVSQTLDRYRQVASRLGVAGSESQ